MGKKKARPVGFTKVTCSKCGMEDQSKAGKRHRRCPGNPGTISARRAKHEKLPSGQRGVWQ